MAKYLTYAGLQTFWGGIKTKLRAKVDVVEGKGLSTNDLTNALKTNYDAAYDNRLTGVMINGVTNASKAVIEGATYAAVAEPAADPATAGYYELVNGIYALTSDTEVVTGKTYYTKTVDSSVRVLNISMPTKLQDLANDSVGKFATESFVTGITGTPDAGKTLVQMIAEAVDGSLVVEVVQALPDPLVARHIYLVPKATAQTSNVYDEYIVVTKDVEGVPTLVAEKIGDTEIDLSDYQTKAITSITIGGTAYSTVQTALEALNTVKQNASLSSAISVDGHSSTTVEDALTNLNTYKLNASDVEAISTEEIEALFNDPTTAGSTDA